MWNLSQDNFKEEGTMHIIQEKTGNELKVSISPRAQEIVSGMDHRFFPWADKSWWQQHNEDNQRVAIRNNLWMCFGSKHTGPNSDWGRLERGRAYCKPKNIRLHTFRHTFAMWKLAAGCPLEVIKDLMGHKSVAMAELYASQLPKTALAKWV